LVACGVNTPQAKCLVYCAHARFLHQIFGIFRVAGKPARKIESGAEVRQHYILKTAGLENIVG
jgi:hypothetical protein